MHYNFESKIAYLPQPGIILEKPLIEFSCIFRILLLRQI